MGGCHGVSSDQSAGGRSAAGRPPRVGPRAIPFRRHRERAGAADDTTGLPPIEYNANAIEYFFPDTLMVMTGSAYVKYGDVELSAGRLSFQTHTEVLTADFLPPAPDIDPETNTYPRLQDETNVVVGDRMQYDMNTGEGKIWKGRTQYQEGFFNGELITLNADRTFEIHDGTYTTCDNPNHLHYYLKMGEAKVVPEDKAVVRNVTGYIMGIPIVYLPVYVFSVKLGRQSGFTVPNYGSGVEEGRYLRNLGYYWAPNEYFDMKTTADIEAKTGFLLRQRFQYRQDRRLTGSASGSWRRGFDGTTTGWDVTARHRQEVIPDLTIRGQGNFAQSLQYLHSTTRGTDPGLLRSTTRSILRDRQEVRAEQPQPEHVHERPDRPAEPAHHHAPVPLRDEGDLQAAPQADAAGQYARLQPAPHGDRGSLVPHHHVRVQQPAAESQEQHTGRPGHDLYGPGYPLPLHARIHPDLRQHLHPERAAKNPGLAEDPPAGPVRPNLGAGYRPGNRG